MNLASIESNPFALLLDPEVVIARVMASRHLAMLNSRVCRPLDMPSFGQEATDGQGDAAVEGPAVDD